jgi:hypothetical protein
MSEIEIITDDGRWRRWTAVERLRIVEETLDDQPSISVVPHDQEIIAWSAVVNAGISGFDIMLEAV